MGRMFATTLFPLVAAALGGAVTAALAWRGQDGATAAAVGIALFAAALAARTWRTGETERPLLADELLGLHDAVDALREDTLAARERLTELAEILEQAVARGALEPGRPLGGEAGLRRAAIELAGAKALHSLEGRVARAEESLAQLAEALAGDRGAASPPERSEGVAATAAGLSDVETEPVGLAEPQQTAATAEADNPTQPAAEAEARAEARDEGETETEIPAETEPEAEAVVAPAAVGRFSPAAADAPFDISLQPVISLGDREPRYFEAQFAAGADPAAALVKAAAVARRLEAAGQSTPILCASSLVALRDEALLRGFLQFVDGLTPVWPGVFAALRLEFRQAEIDLADAQTASALKRLRTRGFAFSLERVEDLSIDIARLARAGFRSVKLDADFLLERERQTDDAGVVRRLVAALDRAGLELIVDRLDRVETLRALRQAGARLGQGEAIAPPRLAAVDAAWLSAEAAFDDLVTAAAPMAAAASPGGAGLPAARSAVAQAAH